MTEGIQQIKQRFGIIGNSPALNRAIDVALQVAPTDLSVLITGESGSARRTFRKLFIRTARANTDNTLRSIVVPSPKERSTPSCSGTKKARLQARWPTGKDILKWPMAGRSF